MIDICDQEKWFLAALRADPEDEVAVAQYTDWLLETYPDAGYTTGTRVLIDRALDMCEHLGFVEDVIFEENNYGVPVGVLLSWQTWAKHNEMFCLYPIRTVMLTTPLEAWWDPRHGEAYLDVCLDGEWTPLSLNIRHDGRHIESRENRRVVNVWVTDIPNYLRSRWRHISFNMASVVILINPPRDTHFHMEMPE